MRFLLAALVAVLLFAVVQPAPQAAAQGETSAQFDVTKITPSVVAAGSPGEVVISGRLTNTGARTIEDVQARVQRGNPAANEPAVQRALRENPAAVTEPSFSPVADRLAPGQQLPVEVRIPLTGPNSLQISQTGVYPLLVNINGSTGGARSRIADGRFLLPVLSPPGGVQTPPAQATPTSMLVPIVDYPRLEREAIGRMRAVLADDELSTSLAPGGRLYDLVQAVTDRAPPGSPLGSALCFAIDPDLLATVRAMRNGYQVRQPNGTLTEGIGAGAADLWLSKLREATNGRCVIALPYADADIVALGRAGLPDLVNGALEGSALVRDLLRVEPRDVVWPIEGALSDPRIGKLPGTALLEPRALRTPAGSLSPVRVRGQNMTAVPIDPLLTSALDPEHDTEGRVTQLSPPPGGGALSAQDAVGALAFRATQGAVPGGTSVLAPPRRWNLRGDDVRALLDGMRQLDDAGFIQPTALPDPEPAGLTEADLNYPVDAGANEIEQPVLDQLAKQNFKVGDLFVSSQVDKSNPVPPSDVTTPLRNGLLRGTSSAWRDKPSDARHWVDRATAAIGDLLGMVRIEDFPGQNTRLSSDSPILVTVVNDLPITVGVVFRIPPVPGMQVQSDFGVATIPANGRRPFQLQTTAQRAGRFSIDVTVTTEAGTQLGSTKRLQVVSTNYGGFIPIVTGIAAALLVLMSVRRIVKRARARRNRQAPPENTPPEDTPPEETHSNGASQNAPGAASLAEHDRS